MTVTSEYLLTDDNVQIHYDHYKSGHAKCVIVAHGYYNSKQTELMKKFCEDLNKEYDVIIFDFRGHGKSKGLFSWTSKDYLDLLAVVAYAKEQYSDIGVIGFSLGAATTLITAAKTSAIKSIVAVAGPYDFSKIDYRFWEINFENDILYGLLGKGGRGKGVRPGPFWKKKIKPIDAARVLTTPVLYIHGTEDWLIKPTHAQKLHEATTAPKELLLIEGGPHAEYLVRKHGADVLPPILRWFHKTL